MAEPNPQIQVTVSEDDERFLASMETTWSVEPSVQPAAEQLRWVRPEARFVAEIESARTSCYPGIYGVGDLRLGVPGAGGSGANAVEVAGLTWVSVHPDHRRQGVLTAMMQDHLDRCRAGGMAISALHASEVAIYGRYGYGCASEQVKVDIASGATLTAPELEAEAAALSTEFVTIDEAATLRVLAVSTERASHDVGFIAPQREYFLGYFDDNEIQARGKEPSRAIFAIQDGRDVGVVTLRRELKWNATGPAGESGAGMLIGTEAARLALTRRMLSLDLMQTFHHPDVGVDDPIFTWAGPRALAKQERYDCLWLRLVDLPAALGLRGYRAECDVVLEVSDTQVADNAGRWRLTIADGTAEVSRTEDAADIDLDIRTLGALYLGGTDLAALHRAGQIKARSIEAVTALSEALRTPFRPVAAIGF